MEKKRKTKGGKVSRLKRRRRVGLGEKEEEGEGKKKNTFLIYSNSTVLCPIKNIPQHNKLNLLAILKHTNTIVNYNHHEYIQI